jgi:hypothetical protein
MGVSSWRGKGNEECVTSGVHNARENGTRVDVYDHVGTAFTSKSEEARRIDQEASKIPIIQIQIQTPYLFPWAVLSPCKYIQRIYKVANRTAFEGIYKTIECDEYNLRCARKYNAYRY